MAERNARGLRWTVAWLSLVAGFVAALVGYETHAYCLSCTWEEAAMIGAAVAIGSVVVLTGLWKAAHAVATDTRAAVFAGLVTVLAVLVTMVLVFGVD